MSFDSQDELHFHNKISHAGKTHPIKVKNPAEGTEEKTPKITLPKEKLLPPELTYTWVGKCPICRTELDTIPLDIDARTKNIVVIAWCASCREKKAQRSVAKL